MSRWIVIALVSLAIVGMLGCGPSQAEVEQMVAEAVRSEVAKMELPVGPVGPQGHEGPRGESGLSGREGPRGDQGPPGREGPRGDTGTQGSTGPIGSVGPAGPTAEMPNVLEVEELIVRSAQGGTSFLRLVAGGDDAVAFIAWHGDALSGATAVIYGGSEDGMVFVEDNFDGTWTQVCVFENAVVLC